MDREIKTMEIVVDFETRSRCNLTKEGATKYCDHPSTEVLCVAWKIDDQPVQYCVPTSGDPFVSPGEGDVLVAHNAGFDAAILARFFPLVKFDHWECTMAQALSQSLPAKLEDLGEYLNLSTKKLAEEGKELIKFFSIPNKKGNFNEPADYPLKFQRMIEYCKTDVETTYQARQKMAPMLPEEFKQWQLTDKINRRGIRVDVEYAEKAVEVLELITRRANDKVDDLTSGVIPKLSMYKRLSDFTGAHSVAYEFLDHYINTASDPLVKKVLQLAKVFSGTNTVKSKYLAMCRKNVDGLLCGELFYYGAHTGRFSSRGVQVHNMAKGNLDLDFYKNVMDSKPDEVLKQHGVGTALVKFRQGIRGAIIPREDHIFIVSDFSKIECQVLFWLAGDTESMNAPDLYKDMAASLDKIEVEDVTPEQRAMGKSIVLGCGFVMGANRFQEESKKYGIKLTKREARKAVNGYRRQFPKVVKFWGDLEEAMTEAVKNPDKWTTPPNGITTWCEENLGSQCLFVKLPSGRSLCYRDVRINEDGELQYGNRLLPLPKKVENVVQAVSRDILCATLLRTDEHFNVVLHVHDEPVIEVPCKDMYEVQNNAVQFQEVMETKETWYNTLVLKAETKLMTRYGK